MGARVAWLACCLLHPPWTGIMTTQMLHRQESQQSQPPAQPSTMPPVVDPKQWLNDPVLANKAGRSMSYALKLLGLGLGASEMEMKMCYSRQLAREYHPDKTTMR